MRPPIVVTGLGRSGTSIMGELIGRHGQTELRHEKSRAALQGRSGAAFRRWYAADRVVVDKEPRWVSQLTRLRTELPEARVVYMIRDGRDVACSVAGALKKKGKTWEQWRTEWPKGDHAETLSQFPGRASAVWAWQQFVREDLLAAAGWQTFRAVRYERLIADAPRLMRGLLEWLQLPEQGADGVYELAQRVNDDPTDHVCPLSAGNFVADHAVRAGRWRNEFTEEERAALPAASCGLLEALGYE